MVNHVQRTARGPPLQSGESALSRSLSLFAMRRADHSPDTSAPRVYARTITIALITFLFSRSNFNFPSETQYYLCHMNTAVGIRECVRSGHCTKLPFYTGLKMCTERKSFRFRIRLWFARNPSFDDNGKSGVKQRSIRRGAAWIYGKCVSASAKFPLGQSDGNEITISNTLGINFPSSAIFPTSLSELWQEVNEGD